MPKQSPLNLDFATIWPGGIDTFVDTKSKPPTPPKKPKES